MQVQILNDGTALISVTIEQLQYLLDNYPDFLNTKLCDTEDHVKEEEGQGTKNENQAV